MRKKWWTISIIFIIFWIIIVNMEQKPKVVSSITTMDTTYLTVLVNGGYFATKEAVAQEIVEMCKENAFEDIKILTRTGEDPRTFYITVYRSRRRMNEGKAWMTIRYNMLEESKKLL